jgi:class 3 adenylate cyclase
VPAPLRQGGRARLPDATGPPPHPARPDGQLALGHGLEKIKTIGDAYMVAGGLPDPRPDQIGRSKFIYEVWGDTVNTASRMESDGVAGCIQVTDRTYRRLWARYRFERRGTIHVKGKGELVTYFLVGRC